MLPEQWNDFDLVPKGGEYFSETARHGWNVLKNFAEHHPAPNVLLAGHGTIISLVLHRRDKTVGLDFHLKMPYPAVYVPTCEFGRWGLGVTAENGRLRVNECTWRENGSPIVDSLSILERARVR